MKKLILFILSVMIISCFDKFNPDDTYYSAKVIAHNPECSSCILAFPFDSTEINNMFGDEEYHEYQAVNLNSEYFSIGQSVDVRLREVTANETFLCTENTDYKNVYVTNYNTSGNLLINKYVRINNYECLYNTKRGISICMDSVINDSRCPPGMWCFWEGDAVVAFHLETRDEHIPFELHTNEKYRTEITLKGYKISLINLFTDEDEEQEYSRKEYMAGIEISR